MPVPIKVLTLAVAILIACSTRVSAAASVISWATLVQQPRIYAAVAAQGEDLPAFLPFFWSHSLSPLGALCSVLSHRASGGLTVFAAPWSY